MSQHLDQVAAELKRAVQTVLTRGLNDPRVRGLVTVTSVTLSPDLAEAQVGISVLPEEHAELSLHGIKHASKHIRSSVAAQVRLRRIPRLEFRHDRSLKIEADTIAAINRGRRRDADSQPPEDDPS